MNHMLYVQYSGSSGFQVYVTVPPLAINDVETYLQSSWEDCRCHTTLRERYDTNVELEALPADRKNAPLALTRLTAIVVTVLESYTKGYALAPAADK
jgi:hypothetical protein